MDEETASSSMGDKPPPAMSSQSNSQSNSQKGSLRGTRGSARETGSAKGPKVRVSQILCLALSGFSNFMFALFFLFPLFLNYNRRVTSVIQSLGLLVGE